MSTFRSAIPRKLAAKLGICAAACLALLVSAATQAQTGAKTTGGYPAKPIHLIVPFPPGGATDILARSVAERLSARLAQPVIIDNKPGAGANIGAEAAAKSAPDGYTLLMGSVASHSIALSYYRKLGYDIRRDLVPISMAGYITNVLVITPNLPVNSVKELIALAKAKPGQLNYATSGTGSASHLAGELFASMAGIKIVRINYKGAAPAFNDVSAGHVQITFGSGALALPHLNAKRLKALAVTSMQRSELFPQLPTIASSGLPGYNLDATFALFAPAKTPAAIITRLNQETVRFLKTADSKQRLLNAGVELVASSPEQLTAAMKAEISAMGKIIRNAGIREE